MPKLHELLAAENTVASTWNTLFDDTAKKLPNDHYFVGQTKTLQMLESSAANEAIQDQARDHKELPTTVLATLEYALAAYGRLEDLQIQKNCTNAQATANLEFRGQVLFTNLPVDQLLGLESRLAKIRTLFAAIPTLDAGKRWAFDPNTKSWVADAEHQTKTEKIMVPVVLAEATDKHPAQVKEATRDNVVGKFTTIKRSGAATAVQKAEAMQLIDELLVEVKKARMRANSTDVVAARISDKLIPLLLSPFKAG